jgi:hypothetical protein
VLGALCPGDLRCVGSRWGGSGPGTLRGRERLTGGSPRRGSRQGERAAGEPRGGESAAERCCRTASGPVAVRRTESSRGDLGATATATATVLGAGAGVPGPGTTVPGEGMSGLGACVVSGAGGQLRGEPRYHLGPGDRGVWGIQAPTTADPFSAAAFVPVCPAFRPPRPVSPGHPSASVEPLSAKVTCSFHGALMSVPGPLGWSESPSYIGLPGQELSWTAPPEDSRSGERPPERASRAQVVARGRGTTPVPRGRPGRPTSACPSDQPAPSEQPARTCPRDPHGPEPLPRVALPPSHVAPSGAPDLRSDLCPDFSLPLDFSGGPVRDHVRRADRGFVSEGFFPGPGGRCYLCWSRVWCCCSSCDPVFRVEAAPSASRIWCMNSLGDRGRSSHVKRRTVHPSSGRAGGVRGDFAWERGPKEDPGEGNAWISPAGRRPITASGHAR